MIRDKMHKKEVIIQEIQRIATDLKVKSLMQREFSKHSNISSSTVSYHFGSWNNAIAEAKLIPTDIKALRQRRILSDEELLRDLIRLNSEFQKEPTKSMVSSSGKYSPGPYSKRWGSVKKAFLLAKSRYSNNNQSVNTENEQCKIKDQIKFIPDTLSPTVKKKRIVFGEPINFRGLRFAPVNEQGVVYLFGIISHELGYLIESVRTDFPDCEGKRCFDKNKNQWEHVKIEFEYKSTNFHEHGHKEEDCDLIVCWLHDWKDCPIKVLELREVIQHL